MNNIFQHKLYIEDINKTSNLSFINYYILKNKSILISGASGMIGSFLVDVIMNLNINNNLNCKIYALGRTEVRAKERFEKYWENNLFEFISGDINLPLIREDIKKVDFVLHLASNTHPKAYATDPIGTITTNIIGTQNMLDFAYEHNAERFLFASTCEVYGENKGDTEKFKENYLRVY